jgi:hypothetical protein
MLSGYQWLDLVETMFEGIKGRSSDHAPDDKLLADVKDSWLETTYAKGRLGSIRDFTMLSYTEGIVLLLYHLLWPLFDRLNRSSLAKDAPSDPLELCQEYSRIASSSTSMCALARRYRSYRRFLSSFRLIYLRCL